MKKQSKELTKYLDKNELKKVKKKLIHADIEFTPRHVLSDFDIKLEKYEKSTGKQKIKAKKALLESLERAVFVVGLDNHFPLTEIISSDRNRGLMVDFADSLVEEYKCKTSYEKALVHLVVGSYAKYLEYSKFFNTCRKIEYLTKEKVDYYSMIAKEADRAHRSFISALTTLQQIKSPPIKVSVKANTAFVAENQQLNKN